MSNIRIDHEDIQVLYEQHVTISATAKESIVPGQIVVLTPSPTDWQVPDAELMRDGTPPSSRYGLAVTRAEAGKTLNVLTKKWIPA